MSTVTTENELWGVLLAEDRLADHNAAEMRDLFRQLKQAVHHCDLDTKAVAEQVGVTEDEARCLLDGGVDLSLSDLEVLLVAVRGLVKITVTPEDSSQRISASRAVPEIAVGSWRPVKLHNGQVADPWKPDQGAKTIDWANA